LAVFFTALPNRWCWGRGGEERVTLACHLLQDVLEKSGNAPLEFQRIAISIYYTLKSHKSSFLSLWICCLPKSHLADFFFFSFFLPSFLPSFFLSSFFVGLEFELRAKQVLYQLRHTSIPHIWNCI
jgi:hypothetical protein